MIERDNNFFMNYEDGGFGGSAMEQNAALANIVNPPAKKQTEEVSASDAAIEALKKQILGQGLTGKWTGQGRGSAEANAEDMAKILAGIGITDIKQFGKITRPVESYVGTDDMGNPMYETRNEETFGNKLTGQAVPNTYSERQTGNFFGGTFEGKGNTGYGVRFDAQGNPLFYTQGASSSDLGNIAPLLTMASFVPGLQPFAMAANAAIAAKQGNPLGVITNLAGMGNLAGISGMSDVANAARFAGAVQSGDPLAMLFSGANMAGVNDIGGVNLKDVAKTVGAVKAIESGDPLTMMLYASTVLPQGGSLTSASGAQKDFIDSEKERLAAAGYSKDQIKNFFGNLERLTEDLDYEPEKIFDFSTPATGTDVPPPTRSITGAPEREEADDFLKSIGINTLDKPSDSGLSNQDILNMVNADNGLVITANRDKAPEHVFDPTFGGTKPLNTDNRIEIVGKADKTQEHVFDPTFGGTKPLDGIDPQVLEIITKREPQYLPTDNDFMPTPIRDEGRLEIVANREPKYLATDDDFMPTPIKDEGVMEIVANRDKTQEHVFDPTFGGTLPLPTEPVASTPSVGAPKAPTPKAPAPSKTTPSLGAFAPLLPLMNQQPVNQPIVPELANVFYFGKNFGGQQQKLSPEGELLTTPYNQLSVTQAGAEPMPQPIPVAQDAKGGENDVSALLQQIMSSGDPNMTQEELMQLIQSRG